MEGEVIAVEEGGAQPGVVRVVLRNAGRLNAMSRPMWRQLRAVFEGIQHNASARCVLIEDRKSTRLNSSH